MAIDVHAHYVPPSLLEVLRKRGADFGVAVVDKAPACLSCLHFQYGLKVRPLFAGLVEAPERRLARMDSQGVTRQVLSVWTDIFGHGLPSDKGTAWHRLLNESLAKWCAKNSDRFSWLASGAFPDAASAAAELSRAVQQDGAIGGVVAANVEGSNLGELPLDEYWAAACELDVPVFIHPLQADPTARTRRFSLNPIAQYTFDTTVTTGSLIFSGVLDRHPSLKLILSHGGGTLPYLIGRFDCLHSRVNPEASGDVARDPPSKYLERMHFDTIVHDSLSLRFLAQRVGIGRMLLGTDDSFPPADLDPLGGLRAADFSEDEIQAIAVGNPSRLFRLAGGQPAT